MHVPGKHKFKTKGKDTQENLRLKNLKWSKEEVNSRMHKFMSKETIKSQRIRQSRNAFSFLLKLTNKATSNECGKSGMTAS